MKPGQLIAGRYKVVRSIRKSATSATYLAQHQGLGHPVVIKVPEGAYFLNCEWTALTALDHPHCVRLLDRVPKSDSDTTRGALVLEYLEGDLLSQVLLGQHRLSALRTVDLVIQTLRALEAVHERGLVHGNLTKDHLLLSLSGTGQRLQTRGPQHVTLLDFATCRRIGEPGPRGQGEVLPQAAPELLSGARLDQRSDLHQLGQLLFECLAGVSPSSLRERAGTPITDWGDALGQLVPCCSSLSGIVALAMADDPEARFQTSKEFSSALLGLDTEELLALDAAEVEFDSEQSQALDTVDVTKTGNAARSDIPPAPLNGVETLLLSTGRPTVWALSGDPGMDNPEVRAALSLLPPEWQVKIVEDTDREALAQAVVARAEQPPWVVLFGDLHVLVEDPLLCAVCQQAETSRILLSTHENTELLSSTVNACGLHSQLCLPLNSGEFVEAMVTMVNRALRLRRRYDNLRLSLRDSSADIQRLESRIAG